MQKVRSGGVKKKKGLSAAPLKEEGTVIFSADVWDNLVAKYPRLNENTLSGIMGILGNAYRQEEERKERALRNAASPSGAEVLTQVASIINGDRAQQHGDKVENHQNIANLWNGFLCIKFRQLGFTSSIIDLLSPHDITQLMILLKVARTQSGAYNIDDMRDAAGYAGVAIDIASSIGR